MIHVAYGIDDYTGEFYEYLGMSMLSLMQNTQEKICFHILYGEYLSESAREQLSWVCDSFGQSIRFYQVKLKEYMSCEEVYHTLYPEGIFYRLYIPELLTDVERVIYLDTDILVNMDIRKLWEEPLCGKSIGGVWGNPVSWYEPGRGGEKFTAYLQEMDWLYYMNTGVLLMDLTRIRAEHNLPEETERFLERFGYDQPDQDALSWIFLGDSIMLPKCYNTFSYDVIEDESNVIMHYGDHPLSFRERNLRPIERWMLSLWEQLPWYHPEYSTVERIAYIYRMKSKTVVYQRMRKHGPLTDMQKADIVFHHYWDGDFAECYREYEAFTPLTDALYQKQMVYYGAAALQRLNRENEALELLEKHTIRRDKQDSYRCEADKWDENLWMFRGNLLMKQKRYEEAAEAFYQSIHFKTDVDKQHVYEAFLMMSKCYAKLERYEEANQYNEYAAGVMAYSQAVKINRIFFNKKR